MPSDAEKREFENLLRIYFPACPMCGSEEIKIGRLDTVACQSCGARAEIHVFDSKQSTCVLVFCAALWTFLHTRIIHFSAIFAGNPIFGEV
jgi:transcription elongation factor Elf1